MLKTPTRRTSNLDRLPITFMLAREYGEHERTRMRDAGLPVKQVRHRYGNTVKHKIHTYVFYGAQVIGYIIQHTEEPDCHSPRTTFSAFVFAKDLEFLNVLPPRHNRWTGDLERAASHSPWSSTVGYRALMKRIVRYVEGAIRVQRAMDMRENPLTQNFSY